MTEIGDLVLVTMEGQPAFFARIEDITADVKPQWYQVKMLVLQVPLLVVTWILREPYINGEEFTMGGKPIQMTKVVAPEETEALETDPAREEPSGMPEAKQEPEAAPSNGSKVVSLAERRKRKPT